MVWYLIKLFTNNLDKYIIKIIIINNKQNKESEINNYGNLH